VAEVYHRTAAGKVTWVDALTRDEVEAAVARAGWEWSLSPRGFAPWPPTLLRGIPVTAPSLADTLPSRNKIWDRAT
jgi:hypothetical protein